MVLFSVWRCLVVTAMALFTAPIDPKVIARRQADMRCRALIGTSTKDDAVAEQCQEAIVYVLPNGRTSKEDPGNVDGHWSKYCKTHRNEMLRNRAADKRTPEGNRAYGPQVILNTQTADPWIDPVEGGDRNRG